MQDIDFEVQIELSKQMGKKTKNNEKSWVPYIYLDTYVGAFDAEIQLITNQKINN